MATPEPRHGTHRTISIVDDVNLLSPQTHTSLPLPLGPLTASVTGAWRGRRRSSCGHPREAMNLVPCASHLPEKPDCKLVPTHHGGGACAFGASACLLRRYVSPGRSPWYSCPVRDSVRFPASVPRVNVRRTGCFMHHAEGRVTTPEGCPENPQRERLEQVGRHPHKTCRLALRTKDPGGPGSN